VIFKRGTIFLRYGEEENHEHDCGNGKDTLAKQASVTVGAFAEYALANNHRVARRNRREQNRVDKVPEFIDLC